MTVSKGSPVACPSGYLPAPVDQGDGEFDANDVECSDTAGCTCGSASGTAKCGLRVRHFNDNVCTNESGNLTGLGGFNPCPTLDDKAAAALLPPLAAFAPDQPAQFTQELDVVFVCVDVEAYERNASIITEIGIATAEGVYEEWRRQHSGEYP